MVSVPSRGLRHLNELFENSFDTTKPVSVPSRGLRHLN